MPETVFGTLLLAGSVTLYATNFYRFLETDLFAAILLVQSLPFLSATVLVWLERSGAGTARQISFSAVEERTPLR
jgi:glucan 1,3-beta-glucosidase